MYFNRKPEKKARVNIANRAISRSRCTSQLMTILALISNGRVAIGYRFFNGSYLLAIVNMKMNAKGINTLYDVANYRPIHKIIVQTIISLLVTIWGVTFIAGDFKEIRTTTELESKSFEAIGNRPLFYTFSHRGRVLSSVYSQGHF